MTERPPAEEELLVDDGDEDVGEGTRLDLPLEIDLDPAVIPAEPTPARGAGEHRARFVAEGQPLGSDGRIALEPGEDDPTVAFRPLGPDDRDAYASLRVRRDPPALPGSLRPPGGTAAALLGPALSARGEITERVQLIPKTHPMANSLAPGGSALSMTPPPKPASRGLFVAGAAALLVLGVGAAKYLQTRGEHHAATEHEAPRAAALTTAPLATPPERVTAPRPAPSRPTPPAPPTSAEAPARMPSSDIARAAPQAPPPKAIPTTAAAAPAPRPAEAIPSAAPAGRAPIKAELGEAALQPVGGKPFRPTLGAIATAVEGVRAQVSACAGDAHGIADVVLRVQATGAITHVLVQSGPFADSPAGSCIAKALRQARVAPFGKPVVHVLYTLKI